MAGQGYKVWTAGEVLAASDLMGYLMDQSVMVFDSSGARGSAIGTATEGMISYLKDTNAIEIYSGSEWASLDSLPSQTSNAGKFLTTNGTVASWDTITTDPTPSVFLLMGA